jgi:hypothetical protein
LESAQAAGFFKGFAFMAGIFATQGGENVKDKFCKPKPLLDEAWFF